MFGFRGSSKTYSPVPSVASDGTDELESKNDLQHYGYLLRKQRQGRLSWSVILSSILFLSSLLMLWLASDHRVNDKNCTAHMSAASPLLPAVEYEWKTFQNDFFHQSKYRGTPTVELEKAWDDLWDYGAFNVPRDMLPKLNQSDDGWRAIPEEKGGGVAGLLEAFHQIHCLNLIRQYTYRDEWDYSGLPSFDGTPQLVRHHVDHCIETLRINLMCTADVTPYLIEVNPARRFGETPNFNTLHKCRKWDKLVEWAVEHEVFTEVAPASRHKGHSGR